MATAARQRVIDAALALFTQRGFAATSMHELADHLGLEPDAAALWLRAGVWPCCARRYSHTGLGPGEAAEWLAAGFLQPAEAAAWEQERFGPQEARDWADAGVGSPEAARACRDAGLIA